MNFFWKSSNKKNPTKVSMDHGDTKPVKPRSEVPVLQAVSDFPRILEKNFGESLGYRTQLLTKLILSDKLSIGPPDLIHLTLEDKFHGEEVGQYFYITGIDLSNESMAISLLKMLRATEKSYNKNPHVGNVSTYCCMNVFSKLDVRIRFESDKKETYQVMAIDYLNHNKEIEMNRDLWEETFVSGCIRNLVINSDPERKLPGLMEYPLGIEAGSEKVCQRIILLLCKFLPRSFELSWDTTRNLNPTLFHNYIIEALLTFLSVTPNLLEFTINTLGNLINEDDNSVDSGNNTVFYRCARIALLYQDGERNIEFINELNDTLQPLFSALNSLTPKDPTSVQILNFISELLNLQIEFLLKYGDYETALTVAKKATELSLDSFNSWYYLAKCYMKLKDFDNVLVTLNSMPCLLQNDKIKKIYYNEIPLYNYYKRPLNDMLYKPLELDSNEFDIISKNLKTIKDTKLRYNIFGRIIMPNEVENGKITKIWENDCLQLGPIYGPQSVNLINFVSINEVESISDRKLLQRSSIANQYSWSQSKVYDLLIELILQIGWNGLLQLRTKLFVMEKEYSEDTMKLNGYGLNKDTPVEIRKKRICERWLDQLFLDIYEDLSISKNLLEDKTTNCSPLEWELLGLIMLKVREWGNAIACLRTSGKTRFDPVSARNLLQLYLKKDSIDDPIHLDEDIVIDLLLQNVSFESRFYNNFQVFNLKVLYKLCDEFGYKYVENKIKALPDKEDGITNRMEQLLSWVEHCLST